MFTRYGADYGQAAEYELDYLITPELGGVGDARNLWPQPFARTPWNAYVKDELERLFHRMVYEGKIDLRTAQREMAGSRSFVLIPDHAAEHQAAYCATLHA